MCLNLGASMADDSKPTHDPKVLPKVCFLYFV